MRPSLLFATANPHKAEEIRSILGPCFEIKTLLDFGLKGPDENGETLQKNAEIKAKYAYEKTGMLSIGEDTGLFVRALGGVPGVYTARFGGWERLLKAMRGKCDRYAEFRTVLAVYDGKRTHFFEGVLAGRISEVNRGDKGFGYDPVFIPLHSNITLAEMHPDEKNAISHRRRALEKFLRWLVRQGS